MPVLLFDDFHLLTHLDEGSGQVVLVVGLVVFAESFPVNTVVALGDLFDEGSGFFVGFQSSY